MSDDMAKAPMSASPDEPKRRNRRNQSQTDGRIGEGKNVGVRNEPDAPGRTVRPDQTARRPMSHDKHDPDIRMGAKGSMQLDIGESICLQPGNDC